MGFSRQTLRLALCACTLLVSVGASAWMRLDAGAAPVLLLEHPSAGRVPAQQGYLGIAFHDVNDNSIGTLHLKDGHGAEIVMVDHDGPAGKAGLREHDVVLSVNGISVEGEDQLRRMLHEMQPGRTVALYVCRDGVERTVNATMANRAEVEKQAWEQHYVVPVPQDEVTVAEAAPPKSSFSRSFMSGHLLSLIPAYTGASVDAMGTQLASYFGVKDGKGLLVHQVEDNSPAAAAGLHAGDVITKVNGSHVATKSDWTRSLRDSKGHPVSLTVVRERHEQVLTMVPDAKKRSSIDLPLDSPIRVLPVMMLR